MSVDIAQLTARLDSARRDAIKEQYEQRATSPTAAFLLCFFLGFAGAHRFYLRQWRSAFGHLALFVLGAAALIAGLTQTLPLTINLTSHPLGAAFDLIGLALLLAALIWEIVDLGRIDHEVYHRNLLLAEGIIAANLLADQTVVEGARQKLAEVAQQTHGQAEAAAAAGAAGAAGIITANEVADARALAEETGGYSSISYAAVSQFDVSADPDQARQAEADAAHAGNWSETTITAEPQADASAAPIAETVTRAHTEEGGRVTDSYEIDRREEPAESVGPSAAELAGLGAAGLGAAGLGAGLAEAGQRAAFDEPTQPDMPAPAAPAVTPTEESDYGGYRDYAASDDAGYGASGYAPEPAEEEAAGLAANGYGFDDELGDVTDHSMPAIVIPPADVAVPNANPAYVQLNDAPAAPEAPEAPLYLVPDEPPTAPYSYAPGYTPGYTPGYEGYAAAPSEEPPADAYVPPVPSVYSAPASEPPAPVPSWEQPTMTQAPPEPAPAVAPEPEGASGETLAGLAGFAGVAGTGALAGEALAHSHAPEPAAAAPEPPKMKKIRVKRQVVLDGKVVDEIVVEREVPADMDTAEAAAKIQEELSHFTPEEIAQRAHLAPNEEVQVRQRNEGQGGA